MVGNPGTGKSTILNSLMDSIQFKSGTSAGQGLTSELEVKEKDGIFYMDTPGLSDMRKQKQAAAAITEALKQDGIYNIFFVITLEAGSVRAADVMTMRAVLSAAPITSYGIIVNKVSGAMQRRLTDLSFKTRLIDAFLEHVPVQTSDIYFNAYVDDLEGASGALWPISPGLSRFIYGLQGVAISSVSVDGSRLDAQRRLQELAERERAEAAQIEHFAQLRKVQEQERKAEAARAAREAEAARRRRHELEEHARRLDEERAEAERQLKREEEKRRRQRREQEELEEQCRMSSGGGHLIMLGGGHQLVFAGGHPMMMGGGHPMMGGGHPLMGRGHPMMYGHGHPMMFGGPFGHHF